MTRKRGRVDSTQSEIVHALRDAGMSVRSLANLGQGMPDIIVGVGGINILMEIKTPSGKLTEAEKAFLEEWLGQAAVVHSVEEAFDTINRIRGGTSSVTPP